MNPETGPPPKGCGKTALVTGSRDYHRPPPPSLPKFPSHLEEPGNHGIVGEVSGPGRGSGGGPKISRAYAFPTEGDSDRETQRVAGGGTF